VHKPFALIYLSPLRIVRFLEANPVDWKDKDKKLANTLGNRKPPTPGMAVFFDFLQKTGDLFTQREYIEYAFQVWHDWVSKMDRNERYAQKVRIGRNFYPSAIDSLHVWGLLVDTGKFEYCNVDPLIDAMAKVDLTLYPNNKSKPIKISLAPDTMNSRKWRRHKTLHRGVDTESIEIILTMNRIQNPGNKRWYTLADFNPVFDKLKQQSTEPRLWPNDCNRDLKEEFYGDI